MAKSTPGKRTEPGPSGRQKPTEDELETRVELVVRLLAIGARKTTIKKVVRDHAQQPDLCARTIESYIARARDVLLAELAADRRLFRAESLETYRRIKADPKASHRDQLAAQERIDKLLALELRLPPTAEIAEYLGVKAGPAKGAS